MPSLVIGLLKISSKRSRATVVSKMASISPLANGPVLKESLSSRRHNPIDLRHRFS